MEISIDNLNESAPEIIRRETTERIIGDENFDLAKLMRPLKKEECWHFCALTIKEIGNERLHVHTYKMLEWLQDITWPGALIVMEKLTTFPPDVLEPNLVKARDTAVLTNDTFWLYGMHILGKTIGEKRYRQQA